MFIEEKNNNYGFPQIIVTTEGGGRISIINYKEDINDIGFVSMMNENGLGGSEYIRNKKDIDNHIKRINQVVWIGKETKERLISFLEKMK